MNLTGAVTVFISRYTMPNTGHTVKEMPHVGKRIAARRERLKLTQTEAATKMGISLSCLANIEAARQLPGLKVYKNICKVLRVSPGKLLEGK
jgi:transcriptional regulator with XRE-family HTH domain